MNEEVVSYSEYPSLKQNLALVQRQFDATSLVFIFGPSGCGKTHVAQHIYQQSRWQKGAWVVHPAASLAATRFESDVFGHVKGAFSGAFNNHKGLVGAAQNGVLCLESIEDMGLENQARLLRFLETRRFRALGDTAEKPFEGGLIFTSRFHPKVLRERNLLRDDLFYRLQQALLEMPPAHWREADFETIARHIQQQLAQQFQADPKNAPFNFDEAIAELKGQSLEGGFHSLFNLFSQAWLHGVSPVDLKPQASEKPIQDIDGLPDTGNLTDDLEVVEKQLLERALKRYDCTRTQLAKKLGISRRALMYKLAQHGLRDKDER